MSEKIKLYTFYSDSHKEIYEKYFLKSFHEAKLDENFELDTTKVEQKSPTGDFNSQGFSETMLDKLHVIYRAIEENENKLFVFSDCDVQFFKNFYDDITTSYINDKVDMSAQSDAGTICAGFFVARANKIFKKFIEFVMKENYKFPNDQVCMNFHKGRVRYSLMPDNKYFSIGSVNGGKVWSGETNIIIPKGIYMHHANFTVGIKNKIELFELIKKRQENG